VGSYSGTRGSLKESRFPVHKWRKAAALDGIIRSARSLWYRSLRSTNPPGTSESPSASDSEVRFRALAARGDIAKGLEILDSLDNAMPL